MVDVLTFAVVWSVDTFVDRVTFPFIGYIDYFNVHIPINGDLFYLL